MRTFLGLPAVLAAFVLAACAHAQTPQARGGSEGPGLTRTSGKPARASLGFAIQVSLTQGPEGMVPADYPVVSSVDRGSDAERQGLAAGDVILAVDGRDSRRSGLFSEVDPGETFTLRVRRGEAVRDLRIQAGEPPRRSPAH